MIRLIVGLGNPGTGYEGSRHNAGFWWVDAAARKLGVALRPQRAWFGLAARADTPQGAVWLLQPMTYMNLSGKAVGALARFHKIAPDEILVVHDELDLPPGEARIKRGGGSAGHNGLKDVHAQLGSADFWRLRLGIGHPGNRDEVVDYVLRKPAPEQRDAIVRSIERSLEALDALLAGDIDAAIQRVHTSKPPRPKSPRATPPPGPGQTEPA